MTGWAWAVASVALSIVVLLILPGFLPLVVAQVGLFALLWQQHMKRQAEITARRVAEREARERQREDLLQRGREEAERDRARQHAESADAPPTDADDAGTAPPSGP
jgi:fatty acid desaturase